MFYGMFGDKLILLFISFFIYLFELKYMYNSFLN